MEPDRLYRSIQWRIHFQKVNNFTKWRRPSWSDFVTFSGGDSSISLGRTCSVALDAVRKRSLHHGWRKRKGDNWLLKVKICANYTSIWSINIQSDIWVKLNLASDEKALERYKWWFDTKKLRWDLKRQKLQRRYLDVHFAAPGKSSFIEPLTPLHWIPKIHARQQTFFIKSLFNSSKWAPLKDYLQKCRPYGAHEID